MTPYLMSLIALVVVIYLQAHLSARAIRRARRRSRSSDARHLILPRAGDSRADGTRQRHDTRGLRDPPGTHSQRSCQSVLGSV